MIRGALAYLGGWVGLVVASGDGAQLTLLLSRSLELGHLVPREGQAVVRGRSLDKARSVTAEDVAGIASEVLALLDAHDAEELTVAMPAGAFSAHLQQIGDAIQAAGTRVAYVAAAMGTDERARIPERVTSSISGWPVGLGPERGNAFVCQRAASLLLPPGEPIPGVETREPPLKDLPSTLPPSAVTDAEPTISAPIGTPAGTRRAGIDPGERWLAIVVTEGDAQPLRLVHREVIEIGSMVPRARPKKIRSRDGSLRVETHQHAITREDAERATMIVIGALARFQVARVSLEWFNHVHFDERHGPRAHQARAVRLAGAREMAARIEFAASLLRPSIAIRRTQAASWRARVAGTAAPKGRGKRQIEPAVREAIPSWPARSEDHERDAAGLAIDDLLDELSLKVPAHVEYRDPRAPAPVEDRAERRQASIVRQAERGKRKRAEKREAVKCGCGKNGVVRRHARVCPESTPLRTTGWAESAMGEEDWQVSLAPRRSAAISWGDAVSWGELPRERRDAITRLVATVEGWDVRTPFQMCGTCLLPDRDANGNPLPKTPVTCGCVS